MDSYGFLGASCGVKGGQIFSGRGNCDYVESLTKGLIITNQTKSFNFDTFESEIETALYASGNDKAWAVREVIDNAFNGGDVESIQEGAYGANKPDGLGAADQAFQVRASECLAKRLMKFNGKLVRVFTVDDNRIANGESTADGKFAGKLGYIYVTYVKASKGTAPNLTVHLYYADYQDYLNKMSNAPLPKDTPEGLVPLTLKSAGAGTVKLVESCSASDVTEVLGADIDTTIFVNASGGNPTTATYAAGAITLSPTGTYAIASASVLKSAGILGYDGVLEYISVS